MTEARVLFVCAAGPRIGGGHVMRSLTLARALAERGAACAFQADQDVARLLAAFAPDMATSLDDRGFDAVVFDHYGLAAPDHRAIARDRPSLAIDDLADRPLAADLVLDSGPARAAADYAGLVPEETRLLLGPRFAPVRPAFAALRETALARRSERPPVRRVLVSLGLTDVGGITGKVVARLLPLVGETALDVVLGGGAPSLPALRERARHDPRIRLHIDTQDMARLTLEADLAVGAGGSTTWERCVLALPALTLVLAANQAPAAAALAAAGATPCLDVEAPDFEAAFDAAITALLTDPDRRATLSTASAAVCDGLGAPRVAEAFLEVSRKL